MLVEYRIDKNSQHGNDVSKWGTSRAQIYEQYSFDTCEFANALDTPVCFLVNRLTSTLPTLECKYNYSPY